MASLFHALFFGWLNHLTQLASTLLAISSQAIGDLRSAVSMADGRFQWSCCFDAVYCEMRMIRDAPEHTEADLTELLRTIDTCAIVAPCRRHAAIGCMLTHVVTICGVWLQPLFGILSRR